MYSDKAPHIEAQDVQVERHYPRAAELGPARRLDPVYERDFNLESTPLAVTEDTEHQAEQRLVAVIELPEASFGIICSSVQGRSFNALVRWDKTGPPQLAGVFKPNLKQPQPTLGISPEQDSLLAAGDAKLRMTIVGDTVVVVNAGDQPVVMSETNVPLANVHPETLSVSGLQKHGRSHPHAESHMSLDTASWALSPAECGVAAIVASEPHYYIEPRRMDHYVGRAMLPESHGRIPEILLNGTVNGRKVTEYGLYDLMDQRSYLADVEHHNPETLDTLLEENVVAFYGSRSSTLGSMLEFGDGDLQSAAHLYEKGKGFLIGGGDSTSTYSATQDQINFAALTRPAMNIAIGRYGRSGYKPQPGMASIMKRRELIRDELASGRLTNPRNIKRGKIFSRDLDRAIQYAQDNPNSAYAQLLADDFPVMFGASRAAIDKVDTGHVKDPEAFFGYRDHDEIMTARDQMSLRDDLPVIGVPRDRIGKVQTILEEWGYRNKVVAIEDLVPLASI
jgi:hypothetical protein